MTHEKTSIWTTALEEGAHWSPAAGSWQDHRYVSQPTRPAVPALVPLCLPPAPVLTGIQVSSVPSAQPAVWSRSLMLCVPQFAVPAVLVAAQKKCVLLPSCKGGQHLCAAARPWRQKKPAKPEISLFQDTSLPWRSPERGGGHQHGACLLSWGETGSEVTVATETQSNLITGWLQATA